MVHIVTNDYCELRRVENTKKVTTKMLATVLLCLLGVSRYWCVLTALSAEKQYPSPPHSDRRMVSTQRWKASSVK